MTIPVHPAPLPIDPPTDGDVDLFWRWYAGIKLRAILFPSAANAAQAARAGRVMAALLRAWERP
jgi:hypothetical protein